MYIQRESNYTNVLLHCTLGVTCNSLSGYSNSNNDCIQNTPNYFFRDKMVFIMTDSQASLKALKIIEEQSQIILNYQQRLQALAEHNRVTLKWVPPEHEKLLGNKAT